MVAYCNNCGGNVLADSHAGGQSPDGKISVTVNNSDVITILSTVKILDTQSVRDEGACATIGRVGIVLGFIASNTAAVKFINDEIWYYSCDSLTRV